MLLLISPAKKLDFEDNVPDIGQTKPALMPQAKKIADIMQQKTETDLKKLMKLSDSLAALNVERYQHWTTKTQAPHAKQAILAFKGDVYAGMAATTFEQGDFSYAQNHLRILSGLYGLLRPLDMIQPHRLEMGTKLENSRGKDLYAYWKDNTTKLINQAVKAAGGPIINLASIEYFKSVDSTQLQAPVITPVFKDAKDGHYKIIGIYAKKARGMMCDFIIRNRLEQPRQLQNFTAAGYRFSTNGAEDNQLLFLRKEKTKT